MAHTYASLAQFNDHLRDSGSTVFASGPHILIQENGEEATTAPADPEEG